MGERRLDVLLEGGAFFEGPRWHERRWWVSDFYRHVVVTVDGDGREETVVEVEGQPSVLRWTAAGGLTVHADVAALCGGHLNDMVVDRNGRAYAGNFGFDLMGGGDPATAALIRVVPDGRASVAAEDMLFPNGS